ncbi:hypothetical protein K1719_010140 [Acacia pycnantha]|nr:hypothetical protein K1719_010140 [Acacia pycnantha]
MHRNGHLFTDLKDPSVATRVRQSIPEAYGADNSTRTNKLIRLPYLELGEERLACLLFQRIQQSKKSKFPTTTSVAVPTSSLYLFLRSVLGLAFKTVGGLLMTLGNAFWLRYNFGLYPRNLNAKSYSMLALDKELDYLLKSCKRSCEINQIHGYMVKTGLDSIPFNLSKLLAVTICDLGYAASIFNYIQNPNLYMFNTMLRGYSISDYPKQTFILFNNLRARGMVLDQFSFITTLRACGQASENWIGQGIHGIALKSGHKMFIDVKNSLLHFYCVCKRIGDGHKLFDEFPAENDLVSWNTLMGGYLVFWPTVVLDLFRKMCCAGLKASVATILCLLTASGNIANFVLGKSLHGHCIRIGFGSDLNVLTALIDMYAKTGHIDLARKVFDGLAERDVVLWNCLTSNYGRIGLVEEALSLIQQMRLQGVKPNSSTLSGLLSACPASGAIQVGV